MISRKIIDSMREDFHDKFGDMSERSLCFKKTVDDIRALVITDKNFTDVQKREFEDCLYAVISAVSTLGYYIGIQDGIEMMRSLTSADFTEMILDTYGELIHS